GRDDVVGGRSRPAQVLVGQVLQLLVCGVGVDRRHHPLLDPEAFVQDLGQGHEAVGGAAGVGDDVVRVGVVAVVVYAHDVRVVLIGRRGRDDDLPGAAAIDVRARLLGVGEEAGGLDDQVDAEVA